MSKVFLILSLIVFSIEIKAQNTVVDRSKELSINALLPKGPGFPVMNYKKNIIQLHAIKNKVLLLDFFDTYCSSCIASMPKLQQLQKEMRKEVEIIMVTWQDKPTIEKFFQTNKYVKEHNVQLPIIYSDTVLKKYFPHKGVPHVAWLYNGKLHAVTLSEYINTKNIKELFANKTITLPRKNDFMDRESLVLNSTLGSASVFAYQDGVPSAGLKIKTDSSSGKQKTSFYNMPIFAAYASAWSRIKKPKYLLIPGRINWQVKDSAVYKHPAESGNSNSWLVKNGICYERFDKIQRSEKEQAEIVLQDLNHFFGLDVYWDKAFRKCIVIRTAGKPVQTDSLPKQGLVAESVDVLTFLIDYSGKYPPAIDESGYTGKLSIPEWNDLTELNRILSFYGLEAIEGEREIEVLVFREK